MNMTRRVPALLFAVVALFASGCRTDNAVKKDAKDAAHDVGKAANKVGNKAEKAIPGDSNHNGK